MSDGWVTSPLVEQFHRGGVPRDIRLMAAQGLLPLKPEYLLELWTDLAGDGDKGVRAAAEKSLASFSTAELLRILNSPGTPAQVTWWALTHRAAPELREVVLRTTSLPHETIEALASLPQTVAELAIINQTRLLRRTSLLVLRRLREIIRIGETTAKPAPLASPRVPEPPDPEEEARPAEEPVRQAAKFLEKAEVPAEETPGEPGHQRLIDDAIRLLEPALETLRGKARVGAQLLLARCYSKRPEGAKRAEELLLTVLREDPQNAEPYALLGAVYAEHGFKARSFGMLRRAHELAPTSDSLMTEEEAIVRYLSEQERQQTEMVSAVQRIYRLNAAERVITALKGTREERAILIRDPNCLVAAAVLSSPRITDSEIEAISRAKGVSAAILQYIGIHPEWAKRYEVVTRLLQNPRTPGATSLALLARLDPSELRSVAFDDRQPEGVRKRALELADTEAPRHAEAHKEWEAMVRRVEALIAITKRGAEPVEGKVPADGGQRVLKAIETAANSLKTQGQTACEDLDELEGLFVLTRDEQEELLRLVGTSVRRVPRNQPHLSSERPTVLGGTQPPPASWYPQAVDLHKLLVRARLRMQRCRGCSASLDGAALLEACARFGALPDELQLSDERAALLLAATDDLVVKCSECGARNEVLGGRTADAGEH